MTLKELKKGENARIISVGGEGTLRQHFLDMGVIPGAELTLVKLAPMGDPMEIMIHGYELTLRLADAENIAIEKIDRLTPGNKPSSEVSRGNKSSHPGLGETQTHNKSGKTEQVPEGEMLSFALVGNQNSGKTTLFNQLTGSNQHVGNFPGVTVDRKDGPIRGRANTTVTDLPGIYSMSPYSKEELVSREFVLKSKPDAIINIVDATNIERNLYLSMQLLEMNVPMVIALNMMDEVTGNGGSVDINRLEQMLGVPVVPITASKNEGIAELTEHAVHVARYRERPLRQDFCSVEDHGGALHRSIHAVIHLIDDHAKRAGLPLRFAASKLIEGDPLVMEQLALDENEKETLEHILLQMETERGLDRSAALADMRFSYIEKVCSAAVKKPEESRERIRSEKIDRLLTGRFTAIPCFIAIMAAIFYLTFNLIGAFLQELIETGVDSVTGIVDSYFTRIGINETVHGLIIDGIFAGVGSVLSFLPIIVLLFLFLSLLEDSGYIARVAFFMDKLLRKIGLSGRSIVPLLIGFGCTVPAVMSSRTLPSERDRRMTVLLTPFMSCTAKLPIFAFFVSAFFPGKGALIMICIYLLGIAAGIGMAAVYKNTLFKGEAVPFVMELPNYRMPGIKNVSLLLWEKAGDFIHRAFSVILIATVCVWFLQSFDFKFNPVADSGDSMMAGIAGLIAPLLKPIGLGDWRICVSFISGFMAKESVVSTIEILFAGGITSAITSAQAVSIMVFSLIYTPCVAAIASVRRELGTKWAVLLCLWQCVLAWLLALPAYHIALMLL